ncbi:MAG: hypothetical protein M3O88_00135 [Actinomycetota bacterium]|nr:hypothetical protein [Actinomycetota bacterium]
MSPEETDPGWGPAVRLVALRITPLFLIPVFRRRRATDGLVAFRTVFLGLVAALPLYVILLAFDRTWNDGSVPPRVLVALVTLGIGSLVLVERSRSTPLDIESPERLAESFRSRTFAGIGFAEAPALLAFVAVLVSGNLWPYMIGLGFSLVGFWLIAPGARELARRQKEIASRSSPLSLVAALRFPGGDAPGAQAGTE